MADVDAEGTGSESQRADGPRRTRALVALAAVGLVAVIALVLNSCPSSRSVTASERQLREGYLEPLTEAGLAVEVLDACHYSRDDFGAPAPEGGWHFSVRIAVSETPDTVAQFLREETGAVILDGRTPIVVQQYRGQPNRGWNGSIAGADGGSVVTVVKNNIATSDQDLPIGWQSICPESRPT